MPEGDVKFNTELPQETNVVSPGARSLNLEPIDKTHENDNIPTFWDVVNGNKRNTKKD